MTCYDSQVIQRLTAIQLDDCGRIPTTLENATPALKGLAGAVTNLTRTRTVDIPQPQPRKAINGGSCVKPLAAPTDRGFQYGLTFCGSNPIFEVITGYKTLDLSGATITGWEDVQLTGSPRVALEIVFTPSADTCEAEETPQCVALLVPMLQQWVRSGDEAYDGENVPDLVMAAQTQLSSNLFANYANAGALPAYFSHWGPKFTAIGTGRSWSYSALIDCPAVLTENPCELVAL